MKIICVGKIKENYWKDAIAEYQKRLQKYTKLELIEVMDSSNANIDICLQEEAERIKKYILEKDYVITLEINAKQENSLAFANHLDHLLMVNPNITFIIGGSNGLAETIRARSNDSLSFSKMTFPHQMFRVILLEQIYRAYRILNHESYHK